MTNTVRPCLCGCGSLIDLLFLFARPISGALAVLAVLMLIRSVLVGVPMPQKGCGNILGNILGVEDNH